MAATLGFVTSLRNARADQITAALDAGAGAALLRLYDGTQPATGGTATTLLSENTCSSPAAPSASGGVLTLSAIAAAVASATGTGTWGRFVDSTGAVVCDMNAGTTAAAIILSTASITSGANVTVSSAAITEGNS